MMPLSKESSIISGLPNQPVAAEIGPAVAVAVLELAETVDERTA